MSFLLCHDCFTWVEPEDNRCPECLLVMDLSAADPPITLLRDVMGDIVDRLGEVRIPRRLLPEWGTLYATTHGLFFVPHETDYSVTANAGPFTGTSVIWSLGSLVWSPFLFLMPFLRGGVPKASTVRILRPRHLSESDSHLMPGLLMDNPGAFFLPKAQILSVSRKRSRWLIERGAGARLLISPVDAPRLFHEKISTLLAAPAWRLVGS